MAVAVAVAASKNNGGDSTKATNQGSINEKNDEKFISKVSLWMVFYKNGSFSFMNCLKPTFKFKNS